MILANTLGQHIVVPSSLLKLCLDTIGIPHLGSKLRLRLLSEVMKSLQLSPNTAVLDAGCGWGLVSLFLSKKKLKVTAIDSDQKRITVAKRLAREIPLPVQFRQATLYKLPFPDQSFSLCLCLEVLEHLRDDDLALRELSRVTKRGGYLIASFPAWEKQTLFSKRFGHLRTGYTLAQFLAKARVFGFAPYQIYSYGNTWFGKASLQINMLLNLISPIVAALAFPLLYPVLILDQKLPLDDHPWNFFVVLSKETSVS